MGIKALTATGIILGSLLAHSFAASDCSSISDGDKRLACYDQQYGLKESVENTKNDGKWNIVTDTSPIDDSASIYLSLSAEDRINASLRSAKPILFIRCESNRTELYIDWGIFVTTGRTFITTRVDKEKAQESNWSMSTDHKASFISKPIPFIKSMIGKDNLLVRVSPYGENPSLINFDIKGLDNAIKPVRETCGW